METPVEKTKPSALCKYTSTGTSPVEEGEIHNARSKVHFGILSALGIQFSVTGAPLSLGTYLSLTIGVGGSPGYFWGFLVVGIFQLIAALAVAELASAIPHSSGPVQWVVLLAPYRASRTLGYLMGWLLNGAWLCILCASCLYPAQLTLALVQANQPDYSPANYHVYLLYCAYALVYLMVNLPLALRSLRILLKLALFIFNSAALYLVVTMLVCAQPKQSARVVFLDFVNRTGWSSDGWVFFIGLMPGLAALGSLDAATHLTDELENPTKQVPIVILGSLGLSFVVGIPMILVYQFCNVDPASMLQPVGGQPLVQLLLNATNYSLALTNVGIALVIVCFSIAGASILVSWSRLYWSLSRDGGTLPFSSSTSKLSSDDQIPLNALIWNTVLALALGTISIASTTAMSALIGASGLCSTAGLILAMGLVLWNGRDCLNAERWLKLGRWGIPIFLIGLLWSLLTCVTVSMPLYWPVTLVNMNWGAVVFFGFIAVSGLYWLFFFR